MGFKCVNGWTKARMLEVVRARPFDGPAVAPSSEGAICMYRTPEGNKCAVGLFLPENHPLVEKPNFNIAAGLRDFPDLETVLPLTLDGLAAFQHAHDRESIPYGRQFGGNAKAAMIDFIENHVSD